MNDLEELKNLIEMIENGKAYIEKFERQARAPIEASGITGSPCHRDVRTKLRDAFDIRIVQNENITSHVTWNMG